MKKRISTTNILKSVFYIVLFGAACLQGTGYSAAKTPAQSHVYAQLPLSFEANRGQAGDGIQYVSRGNGYSLFLSPIESRLVLDRQAVPRVSREQTQARASVRMKLVGANRAAKASGIDELPGKTSYYIGSDPANWHRDVPSFARVRYEDIYPGIDLVYYGNQRQLEYDFIVAAGADPGAIALDFDGIDGLALDAEGNLVLRIAGTEIRQEKPIIYQIVDNMRLSVSGAYTLEGSNRVGFTLGSYDRSQPLVIDPLLIYSTYLGGMGSDGGNAIKIDSWRNMFVVGATESGANAGRDAFVRKLDPLGTTALYTVYLGGGNDDVATAVALYGSSAFVTGFTKSVGGSASRFAEINALAGNHNGVGLSNLTDAFVAKLDPNGAIVYSTLLGGDLPDGGLGISVDLVGDVYVTGFTESPREPNRSTPHGFPTTSGVYRQYSDHRWWIANLQGNNTYDGYAEGFVTKLTLPLNSPVQLAYSTFLGGCQVGDAAGMDIYVSGNRDAYVTGFTRCYPGLETTVTPLGPTGDEDAFVMKLDWRGQLTFLTYLGGTRSDMGRSIDIDYDGNIYVAGDTASTDFPTLNSIQGSGSSFVTKINPAGNAIVFSTYLSYGRIGLSQFDGRAYLAGTVSTAPGVNDIVVTELSAQGSSILHSTQFGGTGNEGLLDTEGLELAVTTGRKRITFGHPIAVYSPGYVWVTGFTASSDFPIVPRSSTTFQSTYGGGVTDGFVALLVPAANLSVVTTPPVTATAGYDDKYTIVVTNLGSDTATGVTLTDTLHSTVKYLSVQTTRGNCTYSLGTITCNIGTLNVNASATITIQVRFLGTGNIPNVAQLQLSGYQYDPDETDNTDTVSTTVVDKCAVNVTSKVSVTGGSVSVVGGRATQNVTLRNTSTIPIHGPVSLVIDQLGGYTTLFNKDADTVCTIPAGSPYVDVAIGSDNVLSPGESTNATLIFTGPTGSKLTYTPRVLGELGSR
jgi:uncharacterized repeat protein (TIGR01451 family)